MHIDFEEYPRNSGEKSAIFGENVNKSIQCNNGYAYSSVKKGKIG